MTGGPPDCARRYGVRQSITKDTSSTRLDASLLIVIVIIIIISVLSQSGWPNGASTWKQRSAQGNRNSACVRRSAHLESWHEKTGTKAQTPSAVLGVSATGR